MRKFLVVSHDGKVFLDKGPETGSVLRLFGESKLPFRNVIIAYICTFPSGNEAWSVLMPKDYKGPLTERQYLYGMPCEWTAHHAVVCFQIKIQMTSIAKTLERQGRQADSSLILSALGMLEPHMSNGQPYTPWVAAPAQNESQPQQSPQQSQTEEDKSEAQ